MQTVPMPGRECGGIQTGGRKRLHSRKVQDSNSLKTRDIVRLVSKAPCRCYEIMSLSIDRPFMISILPLTGQS
jgi:hypothetical protein